MPAHGVVSEVSNDDIDFRNDAFDKLTNHAQAVACFEYDFAKDGGAVGTLTLRGDAIPANALVINGLFVPGKVNLVTTNNDGTISLGIEALADLMATSAAINANLDETVLLIPDFATVGDYISTTINRAVRMVIATHGITAGAFKVYLWYVLPGNNPAT